MSRDVSCDLSYVVSCDRSCGVRQMSHSSSVSMLSMVPTWQVWTDERVGVYGEVWINYISVIYIYTYIYIYNSHIYIYI